MKILLRVFFTFCAFFCTELFAGSLKVNLTPAAAVTAGAQWRVDGGAWKSNGATVNNLANGSHTVDFNTVSGWIAPAAATVTVTSSTTTYNAAAYIQTASLKITLTPSAGQWRIDSGTWRASAATVTGLTPGSHAIDYLSVTGYISPATETITLTSGQTTTFTRSYIQLSSLKLTLTPTSGQWRIDGGTWKTSGTTVTNLTPGSHTVDYSAVAGYGAPSSESVTLISGQTTALTRSYTPLSSLKLTLTPTTAQWRVDGGAWNASGITFANLTPGAHTVDYAALAGYSAPASESVTLVSGQTLSLTRSFVQLAKITVTLTPGSGQWKVDGGAWQNSGVTLSNLTPGSHTINYSALSNYKSPASESVTLTAGQSLSLARSYIQLAQISINLVPASGQWRANAGAWQTSGASLSVVPGSYLIEYSTVTDYDSPANESITLAAGGTFTATRNYTTQKPTLRINLTPATGQWRVDAGTWQASGAQVTGLSTGTHNIVYTDIGGTYNPLPAETISLALRENSTISRAYPSKPPASLTITLDPVSAQWRVDGGAWQSSGVTVSGLAYDVPHTVEYAFVAGYTAPVGESVTIASGQNLPLARSYVQLAQISITLTPATGQWNVDGGAWLSSGDTATNLTPGLHTFSYSTIPQYASPSDEEFELTSGQSLAITRSYIQLVPVSITLVPANGQWSVDGEVWNSSGSTAFVLPDTNTNIYFTDLMDYDPPASGSITVPAGGSYSDTLYYNSLKPTLRISLTASVNNPWGNGQWRVDGGAWQNRDAIVSDLSVGTHVIDYTDIGHGFAPLPSESITLALRENAYLTRTYALKPPASLKITLDPAVAQWRADGGAWQSGGTTINLSYDTPITVDYAPVAGYSAPVSETVTIASGQTLSLSRSYVQLPKLSITLTPATGEWSVDGGTSQTSGATVIGLAPGSHTISYKPLTNYARPTTETISLAVGQTLSLARSYTQLAALIVILDPASAQWRIDGGIWTDGGINFPRYDLSIGTHTVEYSAVPGYATPPAETVTLVGGPNTPITRTYAPLGSISVTLNPSSAQWRINGVTWLASGAVQSFIPLGVHTIEYADVAGFITPPSETVTIVSGINPPLTRTYVPLATFGVILNPSSAKWRPQGSSGWTDSGQIFSGIPLGNSTFEFSDVPGYITPAPVTVNLVSGINPNLTVSYAPLATFGVTLNPSTAQWRIVDPVGTSPWFASGTVLPNLPLGVRTIEYSSVAGYITPPSESVNLVSGTNPTLNRSYTALASLSIDLSQVPVGAQWRIDSGAWNSAITLNNLSLGAHTIDYADVIGYLTPSSETITLVSGTNTHVAGTYTPIASLYVNLGQAPIGAQWRIDGGSWNLGAIVLNNLSLGAHTIDYSDIVGYITPPSVTVTLVQGPNNPPAPTYIPLASLYVNLGQAPSGAQWQLDNGAWNLGATVLNNLSLGAHTINYSTVVGFITPPSVTVALVSGPNNPPAPTYIPLASLYVDLSQAPSGAQWRIDGGAWNLGATVLNNLSLGAHTISYSNVVGYVTPPAVTVTLVSGPNNPPAPTYIQLASLTVAINASNAQWRIDGGVWYGAFASAGTTANNLLPGPHTIEYAETYGYVAPVIETVTLVSGSNNLVRFFVEKSSVTIAINASNAQWRIDGGVWYGAFASAGTTAYNLLPGPHTIEYGETYGYVAPAIENITLAPGTNNLVRSFVEKASVTVAINASNAQWRIDGGVWYGAFASAGTTANNLLPGPHTIEYAETYGYVAPAIETVTLVSGSNNLVRFFVEKSSVTIAINASNAQWRIDGGVWYGAFASAGTTAFNLLPGPHTIEYGETYGYVAPAIENITLAPGTNNLVRSFVEKASVTVAINAPNAQWRIDGGVWYGAFASAGTTAYNLLPSPHTIEYAPVWGYLTPPTETVNLVSGSNQLTRTFAERTSFTVSLTPNYAKWRLAGGQWNESGSTIWDIPSGDHPVEYSTNEGYLTPPTETITITPGVNSPLTRNYAIDPSFSADPLLATINVELYPSQSEWRIDGGAWNTSGAFRNNLSPGSHTIEYAPTPGFATLPAESIQLVAGLNPTVFRSYTDQTVLSVSLYPSDAYFRIDGGEWQSSASYVTNPALGIHNIEYSPVWNYTTPPAETILITSGFNFLTRSYIRKAELNINLGASGARWRIDGSAWLDSAQIVKDLTPGPHNIEYSPVWDYVTPPAETITLVSGSNFLSRPYAGKAELNINLGASGARWRIDGSAWLDSAQIVKDLSPGPHNIEYASVWDYVTPPSENVTLVSGSNFLSRPYAGKAELNINLAAPGARWRVDGSAWLDSAQIVKDLSPGPHNIEYSSVWDYVTPLAETVTLVSGSNFLSRPYAGKAELNIYFGTAGARWRIDGSAWMDSAQIVKDLSPGPHTLEYSPVWKYITPPTETVNLVSGSNALTRAYLLYDAAQLTVSLNPNNAQWRISSPSVGGWNNSGATVGNLEAGIYSIEYGPVFGYDAPASESFGLNPNDSKIISRSYSSQLFVNVKTNLDSGNTNNAGTSAGTSTTTGILGSDGYLYYAAYAEPGNGLGHIFRLNQDGTGYTELKRFGTDPFDGNEPRALVEASDGKLYGCTKNTLVSSPTNQGTVFKMNKDGTGYAVIHIFATVNQGLNPNALIEGTDGQLYGTTEAGGVGGTGTVFRLGKDGSGYTVLSSIYSTYGSNPQAIVEGPGGFLFGTARNGGSFGYGTIFKLAKNGTGLTLLKAFTGTSTGTSPRAGLLVGSDGLLYGTLATGGSANKGLVFRLNPDGTGYLILRSFTGGSDGSGPETALTEDAGGMLYGITLEGGSKGYGTVFKLSKTGVGYAQIASLSGGLTDGGWPRQRLIAAAGKLYGSGSIGGTFANGILFKLNADGTAFTVLNQNGTQFGSGPEYRVIESSDGALIGTTCFGGTKRLGTVYRINKDGTGYTVLHTFDDTTDGGLSLGLITEASDGFIYGTTLGAQSTYGTIYRIAKDGSSYTVVHHFDGVSNGLAETTGVIEGSNGALYGTCTRGGAFDLGGVYRMNKDGTGFAFLHYFAGGTNDGATPKAELYEAEDGRLYGTTSKGGTANLGTLFGLNKDGSNFNILYRFTGGPSNGASPMSRLCQSTNGYLYGTTPAVTGHNQGTVYRIATNGSGYTVLRVFNIAGYGIDPASSGFIEKNGVLYGTTAKGGTFGNGTIYSINPDGSNYLIWVNISGSSIDGSNPAVGLTIGSNGAFYGTSYNGNRIASSWVIFRFLP